MEGGAAAPSGGGQSAVSSSTVSDSGTPADAGANGELTETADMPIPVAPYALVGRSRRCLYMGYEDCRR
jgi:hypothetical protein